jgi:4-diphosphocytidyl-2-C-methyl-D-erythritol kinase
MLALFLLMTLTRQSPCKVNLLLNVLGKRADGYHELETILQPVGLCDLLHFERRSAGLEFTVNHPGLPADSTNLVQRAASAFLEAARIKDGVGIHLEKNIPVAAGLGGGSGNAANTLLGLNELFGRPLSFERLTAIAATLGSDVPFFLQDKPALATGRGERITPLDPFPALRGLWLLLVHPGFGISTAWAYRKLAKYPEALAGKPGRAEHLISLMQGTDLAAAARQFYNALEAPALAKYPLLAMFQEFLTANGAVAALMSGSGSTTFALVRRPDAAEGLKEKFIGHFSATCWIAVIPL